MSIYNDAVPLFCSAHQVAMLSEDSSLASIPVLVLSSGEVSWLAPANFESNCDLNIQYYPFDKQSCDIVVSLKHSIMYDNEKC